MANWKYNLGYKGEVLKGLINGEETLKNIIAIYKQMIICLEYLNKKLLESDREDWEYEIEAMIEDLQCACPDIEDNDLDYYDERDNLNFCLKDFYDMCDDARVWIGV